MFVNKRHKYFLWWYACLKLLEIIWYRLFIHTEKKKKKKWSYFQKNWSINISPRKFHSPRRHRHLFPSMFFWRFRNEKWRLGWKTGCYSSLSTETGIWTYLLILIWTKHLCIDIHSNIQTWQTFNFKNGGKIQKCIFVLLENHWREQHCSGLEKSPFGAKSDFEIRAFKGFLYMYKKISPKKGLEVFTPKNLKWKKYIRQSENANGTPLEPLWGSK